MRNERTILFALKPERLPPDVETLVRSVDPSFAVAASGDRKVQEEKLADAEIVAGDVPADLLGSARKLRWVQTWSAGTDWLQKHPETVEQPFLLTNTSGMHGPQMAEHLFALLLAWCRKLPAAFAAQGRSEWRKPRQADTSTLEGKTMLVLGFGSIGERVAAVARAFGMEVIGVRRSAGGGEPRVDGVRVASFDRLPVLLPLADVLVDILPHTDATRSLVDARVFGRMKPTALFANIGRGGTVNERDLEAALAAGTIAGALLDVAAEEPLPPSSPLWKRENVLITAHYAGFRPDYDRIAFAVFRDNLGRYARGEALRNLVDKRLGY